MASSGCTGSERLVSFSAVRKSTGSLTIYNVGSNGQDRGCGLGISVSLVLLNLLHEGLQKPYCKFVCSLIIVTIFREFAFGLEVDSATLVITDNFNLSILNSGQGVSHVVDSISAIKYAKVNIVRDETGFPLSFNS